jgi:putative ABC transport system ATP-binding protein
VRPSRESGFPTPTGEQQRVALARAFVAEPELVLADEPTGILDPIATELVLSLLDHLRELSGTTVVVATHSQMLAGAAEQVLILEGSGGAFGPSSTLPG